MASSANVQESMPRVVGRQTMRANYQTNSPEVYYKQSVTIPMLDSISSEMEERLEIDMLGFNEEGLNIPTCTYSDVMKLSILYCHGYLGFCLQIHRAQPTSHVCKSSYSKLCLGKFTSH